MARKTEISKDKIKTIPVSRNKSTDVNLYSENINSQKASISRPKPDLPNQDKEELDLNKTHKDWDCLSPKWDVLFDCFEGGGAIENAPDDKYLIKKQNEADKKYERRKREAVYYNKCEQVISTFQGHLWRKEPLREIPKDLEKLFENVDRQEKSVNKFFSFVTEMAQVLGLYYVLVEYPENPQIAEINKQSKSDEQRLGLRPYFCYIDPRNLLDWGWRMNPDGTKSLAYVVIKEETTLFNVPFLERKDQIQYRVIYPNKQEIWVYQKTSNKKEEAVKISEKPVSIGTIPLVPFYSKEVRFGVGKSAVYNIANLALELYNKHSDRNHAEVRSAFPLLFMRGFDQSKGSVTVSEDHGIISEDVQADVKYVEFTGASINSLRQSELDIVLEIFDLALKQVRNTSSQRMTAESKRMDRLDALSDLQARAIGFANSERKCWEYALMWMGQSDKAKSINISYNIDYNVDQIKADLIGKLLDMRAVKDLSQETFWDILTQGEILPRGFDPEEEKTRLEEEEKRSLPFDKNIRTPDQGFPPKEGEEEEVEEEVEEEEVE